MHPANILSNKNLNLDKKVWVVMFVTAFISIGFISFSFAFKEECKVFTLDVQGLSTNEDGYYEVGEPVFFRASLATEREIMWDFGDKSEKQISRSVTVKHTFIKEGTYSIAALANGTCYSEEIKVNIKQGLPSGRSGIKAPKILGNASPKAGQLQTYISDFIGGTDYEWKVLDRSTFPTINEQSAKFTFPKPGNYRLQLTVDHDRNNKRAILEINVEDFEVRPRPPKPDPLPPTPPGPKPPKPDPLPPTPPGPKTDPVVIPIEKPDEPKRNTQIGNRGFKTMLQSVVAGETRLEDFDEYLFSKGNTLVIINEEKSPKRFHEFYNQIKGKKYSIVDVKLIHDTNVETIIKRIEVKLKDERSLFRKIIKGSQDN